MPDKDKDKEPETAKEQVNSKPGNQSDLEEAFPTLVNDQVTD